ncbi:MAG: COX15/CtaA family protein [Hymenobacteraceae bacterium]|mgnify:CR=1 FL=1|nr:COX15/CtaA family protein [Hymenobacteraceae bacterium]MDX5397484.1 COX15/CtaA family protein [Hymenobacteraceae bacterium]MDX5442171.1 COX15/CtaA family protein [Hymenobacteraceae bacterium]MDX5513560.1 COX15/CtaA family protein [Hymenobacteraceae bacterium]
MTQKSKYFIIYWLLSGVVLVTAMVVIGGITRLTGSGLSIVEWKVISGTLPPLTPEAWNTAFEQYKQFPEYQKLRQGMQLHEFKSIFWWEFVHRLLGRFTGLVFIIPFLMMLVRWQLQIWLLRRLLIILALGAAQGLMGWLMVKSGLQNNPHVSHYRLAMHLSLALFLISTFLWTVFDLVVGKTTKKQVSHPLFPLSVTVLAVLFVQIVFGAFVAGLKAGFSYNTFPLMNGEFFPAAIAQHLSLSDMFDNGVSVQFIHRWFAMLVLGLVLYAGYFIRKQNVPASVKLAAALMGITGLVQVLSGIATLVLAVPLVLGVLHQVMAVVLFSEAVFLAHRLRYFKHQPLQDKIAVKKVYAEKATVNQLLQE